MRPAAGNMAGFMAASPFLPLVAPTPVGIGATPEPNGRGVGLDTRVGAGGGAQGLAAAATGVWAGWKAGVDTGSEIYNNRECSVHTIYMK